MVRDRNDKLFVITLMFVASLGAALITTEFWVMVVPPKNWPEIMKVKGGVNIITKTPTFDECLSIILEAADKHPDELAAKANELDRLWELCAKNRPSFAIRSADFADRNSAQLFAELRGEVRSLKAQNDELHKKVVADGEVKVWTQEDAEEIAREELVKLRAKIFNKP